MILQKSERVFYKKTQPLGFILFQRNCGNQQQLTTLIEDLRDSVGRDAPILIDQEGGRVQRLRPPAWRHGVAAGIFGKLFLRDPSLALHLAHINARVTAEELFQVGIDVNCAPVLDLQEKGGHSVIGDRAFSSDPEVVKVLGQTVLNGFATGGVLSVIKHIPGHGRATADSHLTLPSIDADIKVLRKREFYPFMRIEGAVAGMTGHLLFSSLDRCNPVTFSNKIIEDVIRKYIGFSGLLISDDLSMGALDGELGERATRALEAGCDIALHCNADMGEMQKIAYACQSFSNISETRIKLFLNRITDLKSNRLKIDVAKALSELEYGIRC